TYTDSVSVSLAANDTGGSGVDKTYYTTDGSTPDTGSPVYSGPFTLTQSATVKFFSTDVAGNTEQVESQQIQVQAGDQIPPVTTISCNNQACSSGWYTSSPVTVTLTATDQGGSGVASTHYTTDGTDPTLSSPAYTAPFDVSATTTVKFRSWDNAGNVERSEERRVGNESRSGCES